MKMNIFWIITQLQQGLNTNKIDNSPNLYFNGMLVLQAVWLSSGFVKLH